MGGFPKYLSVSSHPLFIYDHPFFIFLISISFKKCYLICHLLKHYNFEMDRISINYKRRTNLLFNFGYVIFDIFCDSMVLKNQFY